jgi:uncharacterized protein YneF (UPF0154 family)
MTAEMVFSIANSVALVSWLLLLLAVWRKWRGIRDQVLGRYVPLALSFVYSMLIVFFFAKAQGGFDSLSNVKLLFTSDWAALAGWVHYLAFDLFVGSWIARKFEEQGLTRWPLIVILPLTFMFGPMGLVAYEVTRILLQPQKDFQS